MIREVLFPSLVLSLKLKAIFPNSEIEGPGYPDM